MNECHTLVIVRFCLVFTLAIAVAAIGLLIFSDYLFRDASINRGIALRPGDGLISLMVSVSLLTLVFRRSKASTVVASVTIIMVLGQVALPTIPVGEGLKHFVVSPPLAFVILLTELTLISAIHLKKGGLAGMITGPFVVATGLVIIASHWLPSLHETSLGALPESTIIVSLLVIMVGLSLPFFHTIYERDRPDLSPAPVLIGVSAIALTATIWHNMRIQNSNSLQYSAAVLADQLAASGKAMFSADLALIRRLAKRQELLTGLPDDRSWTQEAQSYLNDFPHIRLIGILNPDRKPTGIHSRADQYHNWLSSFLKREKTDPWLNHVSTTGQPHLSPPWPEQRGRNLAMIASPVPAVIGQPWHVVAIVDLENVFSDLLGEIAWDMFPDAVGSEIEQQYRHAMETGESVSFDAPYPPLDEWFEVSAYPSEEGLAVYYRSIKERKLAEQQLEQTMAELERSNRELQDFAFVASHDLQEPLRKIQAFSDRLLTRSDHFDEQEQDYLNRMQSAAKRMQSLIQDLLTYSRVTTQAQPLALCDTNQILSEVLQNMETMVARENADIDITPLPTNTGDATQLRQVLQNLLSNAIKFHRPDQNPQVSIHAENESDHGWTLIVSDKGVGFDERYARKLFHPFQRLHKQGFAGSGIGMAIVKKILDRHGATVTVKSGIDQGTTFRIHFPTGNNPRTASND